MALLGQGFRPELGVYDYSGITRANEMMGNATANLGQQIGAGIKDYTKEQKELQADIAKGKTSLAHFKTLNPELSDKIDELGSIFKDPTKSKVEQAAAGRTMSDDVASFISSQRYGKEFAMKERELGMREQQFQQQYGATQMEIERQRASNEAKTEYENASAPMMLDSVIGALQKDPKTASLITAQYVEQVKTMSPEAKLLSAKSLLPFLPEKEQMELVKDYPVTVAGKTGTMPVMVGKNSGEAFPVSLVPQGGADGSLLPPRDLVDANGVIIPANEAELVADNSDSQVFRYLGKDYVVPKEAPSLPDGFTPTESNKELADQELKKLQIEKTQGEIAAQKAQSEQAAVSSANNKAKADSALASLKEIRNHPGRWAATGKTSYAPSVRGSDSYDFEQKLEQAKALAGTIGIEAMRGLGAMSEKEFQAAKDSIAQLSLGQKTETVEKELDKLISLFETKIKSAATPAGTAGVAPAPVDPVKTASSKLQGLIIPR